MNGFATDLELTAEGAAPEWVHLIPPGRFTARDGRVFDNTDPDAIIEAFGRNGADLPVDYQHQNDRPEATRSGPVPAAGWIKELAGRADDIWGRVDWTERARGMITRREYRYLSPVLKCRKTDRRILMLKGAGLVHSPALHLTELAEEDDMPDTSFASRVAEALGLAPDASEADILALLARVRAAMTQVAGSTELAQMDAPPARQRAALGRPFHARDLPRGRNGNLRTAGPEAGRPVEVAGNASGPVPSGDAGPIRPSPSDIPRNPRDCP